MSGFRFKTLILISGLLPALASAEIYRWTDETGKVHYSDKAPAGVNAEKKEYVNVATPWRKIPKPVVDKEQQPQIPEKENSISSTKPQSEPELPQDNIDKKKSKKTKRLKEKQSDTDSGDSSTPVKLNNQDKSSNTPAKRAAEIKESYREAKKAYGNTN